MFKCNVGTMDRIIRVVFGAVLVYFAYANGLPWLYIGVLPIVTGLIGFCPAYLPFKFSSCESKGACCSTDEHPKKNP